MKKIKYILSGPEFKLGYDKELTKLLVSDAKKASKIVFIASSFDDYENTDKYANIINDWFKSNKIIFKSVNIIDNRVSKEIAVNYINDSDIVVLMGGDTLKQISYIKSYGIIDALKSREGITIGISAGSINMCSHVVLTKDENDNIPSTVCYEGIGLSNVNIEPHFDFINIEHNRDIFEASSHGKIVCLPNTSFIRIEDDKEQYYGNYYVIEDNNLEQQGYPYDEINHLGTVTLETERLILRKATMEDVNDLFYIQLDPDLRRYIGQTKLGKSIDREQYFFSKVLDNYRELNFYRWTIVKKEENLVIGSIMLNILDEKGKIGGIDYYLRKDHWNNGYMTEAAKRVIDFAFNDIKLNRIEAGGSINNPGTYKVLEHIGLKYEGLRKQGYFYYYGGIQDLVLYGLTKEDHEKENKN